MGHWRRRAIASQPLAPHPNLMLSSFLRTGVHAPPPRPFRHCGPFGPFSPFLRPVERATPCLRKTGAPLECGGSLPCRSQAKEGAQRRHRFGLARSAGERRLQAPSGGSSPLEPRPPKNWHPSGVRWQPALPKPGEGGSATPTPLWARAERRGNPDAAAPRRRIFGEKVVPNLVLLAREQERY